LGFVAETERQVSAHLKNHLDKLPLKEQKTRVLIEAMQEDESMHAETAEQAGGIDLPIIVQNLMSLVSKLMTKTSYYL
jgi:ubiquinone biosynthesis monooxygenase Coq7